MAKKFDVDTARRSIKKGIIKESGNIVVAEDGKSKFYRDYFDLETGKPIEFDKITTRIKKRFKELDKLSVLSMLDLYFVHQNWQSFYNRQESFKSYVTEELKISRVYAYGVLNAVSLVDEYLNQKGKMCNTGVTHFANDIAGVLDNIGIKKLRDLSRVKDKPLKYGILDRLFDGEELTSDEIVKLTKKIKPSSGRSLAVQVVLTGTNVSFKNQSILNFNTKDDGLINAVVKAVKNYYKQAK